LKLLTPPFVVVPIAWLPRPEPIPAPAAAEPRPFAETSNSASFTTIPEAPLVADLRKQPQDGAQLNPEPIAAPNTLQTSEMTAEPDNSRVGAETSTPTPVSIGLTWERRVGALWLTGSVLWWTVAGARLIRFRMSLYSAWPA